MSVESSAGDVAVRIAALNVYPVKSCAGIALDEAPLAPTGLDLDRDWMLCDGSGEFVSQRDLPRLALVRPTLKASEMVLRAPGMLALHVSLDTVERPVQVRVWNDTVRAFDMGDLAARWFSDFVGTELRMVRFDPDERRYADRRWTAAIEAETAFVDAFPLLVVSTGSLAELNRRLVAGGHAAVGVDRFRPNIVLDGVDANGEDQLDEMTFQGDRAPIRIKLVKPCSRCSIPDVDPATGEVGHAVADALAGYRADPRLAGAITFGMNAVIVSGFGERLRVGMAGTASIGFA